MRRSLWFILAPPLASSVVLLASSEASAGVTVHLEQDFAVITNGGSDIGFGLSGRVGYRVDLGPLWLAPELGGGYLSFGDIGRYSLHPSRMYGGGRVGLGGFLQPQLYAHAGYGWMGGLGDVSFRGAMFEVGVALDVQLLPIFGIGTHLGYASNDNINGGDVAQEAFNWVNFGVHAGLTF